jgi:hypothetical protein
LFSRPLPTYSGEGDFFIFLGDPLFPLLPAFRGFLIIVFPEVCFNSGPSY